MRMQAAQAAQLDRIQHHTLPPVSALSTMATAVGPAPLMVAPNAPAHTRSMHTGVGLSLSVATKLLVLNQSNRPTAAHRAPSACCNKTRAHNTRTVLEDSSSRAGEPDSALPVSCGASCYLRFCSQWDHQIRRGILQYCSNAMCMSRLIATPHLQPLRPP